MTQKTNAARLLDQMGIRYELREYEVDPAEDLAAEAVAAKIGLPPGQLFKTLVAQGDRYGNLHGRDSRRYGAGPEGTRLRFR
jgi:Cys-tRNA(Pro)/Cys-tRNA(Cys) deacylase